VLSITNGDVYTKALSDILFHGRDEFRWEDDKLPGYYNALKSYNKNVFPIKGFDLNGKEPVNYYALDIRGKVIDEINKLPSIAKRNLKGEIRTPRDSRELGDYLHLIEYFSAQFSLLSNKDEKTKSKIYQKMFKSNATLKDLVNFADDKENLLGGEDFTKDNIQDLIDEGHDLEVVFDKNNVMVVEVGDPRAIKAIGCNSLWCFTYGEAFDSAYRMWSDYSTNDVVYVIVNFNEPSGSSEFMHVLIKPVLEEEDYVEGGDYEDEQPLYDMSNEQSYNTIGYLEDVVGDNFREILSFEY